jgi:hypothetical protein
MGDSVGETLGGKEKQWVVQGVDANWDGMMVVLLDLAREDQGGPGSYWGNACITALRWRGKHPL